MSHTGSFHSHIAERVHVEAVGEMDVVVAVADIDVGLGEWRLGVAVVEVFHRYHVTFGDR